MSFVRRYRRDINAFFFEFLACSRHNMWIKFVWTTQYNCLSSQLGHIPFQEHAETFCLFGVQSPVDQGLGYADTGDLLTRPGQ